MAFLPGSEGGAAVADVVYGRTNPSGRLPVSWPKSAAQMPLFYNHPPGKAYDPRYAFGHGLSYTSWDVGRLRVSGGGHHKHHGGGSVRASATIANTGGRSGDHVVLAFAEPLNGGSEAQPVRELVAFERVSVERRRARGVDLSFDAGRLQPGDYRLVVGDESARFTVR
jgi:beta-glucosidase